MPRQPRCPRCGGRLFADVSPGEARPEPACLTCGWRRVVTLGALRISAPEASRQPRLHTARPGRRPVAE
jgi:DNA-directed RNA polymerase subunit RPC12/RpoP